jgi:hypothetical protein
VFSPAMLFCAHVSALSGRRSTWITVAARKMGRRFNNQASHADEDLTGSS